MCRASVNTNFYSLQTCSKIFLHIVNKRWVCSLIHIWIRRQFPLLFVYKQERSNHMFSMNEFFWTTVMRIVQLMTDRSRYFNPSKNYWFNFNAFLISLIGLYFLWLSFRVILVNIAPSGWSPTKLRLKVKFFWSDKNGVVGSKLSFK
jgi:hypothetical protein